MKLEVGKIYGNGKGLYRKIVGFTKDGEISTVPYDVWWTRCDKEGSMSGNRRVCWVYTFTEWAKEVME